jgi:hypothetical protein
MDLDLPWETSIAEAPVSLRILKHLRDQLGTE